MDRKSTTKFLSNLLITNNFSGIGKYWASEVSLDYGTKDVKRVDFMQFIPENTVSIDGIEKGIFVCFEIKSCMEDLNSGHGLNFIGEKNYIVMPTALYVECQQKQYKFPYGVGVMVAIPKNRTKEEEIIDPTPIENINISWKLCTIKNAKKISRKYSMIQMLFNMLRAGH